MAATSASIVFWTMPDITSRFTPARSARSDIVSVVAPPASCRRNSPAGRTGPAMVSNASSVSGW